MRCICLTLESLTTRKFYTIVSKFAEFAECLVDWSQLCSQRMLCQTWQVMKHQMNVIWERFCNTYPTRLIPLLQNNIIFIMIYFSLGIRKKLYWSLNSYLRLKPTTRHQRLVYSKFTFHSTNQVSFQRMKKISGLIFQPLMQNKS